MNTKTAIAVVIALLVVGVFTYFALFTSPVQNEDIQVAPQGVEEQESQASGKIDINTVCEGALAYMTFPDGATAELFVSECKEGKHPEVIEKFKADMNVGAGAQI